MPYGYVKLIIRDEVTLFSMIMNIFPKKPINKVTNYFNIWSQSVYFCS